jgi:excisionase family DNA binding protein
MSPAPLKPGSGLRGLLLDALTDAFTRPARLDVNDQGALPLAAYERAREIAASAPPFSEAKIARLQMIARGSGAVPAGGDTEGRDVGIEALGLLTVPEVAARLRLSAKTVWRLVAATEIESVKVGRLRRIPPEAVAAYIARLRGGG